MELEAVPEFDELESGFVILKILDIQIAELSSRLSERNLSISICENARKYLVDNGYDRADSQLLDLGDGRIMLAFIADDPERSDEERTALMYSIYDNGS